MTPRVLLRIEGLLIALATLVIYNMLGLSWRMFFVLLLAPDLFVAGYLAGPRIGAHLYNAGHTYVVPLILGGIAVVGGNAFVGGIAVIWTTHIGMDRALGYGLKRPSGFHDTHLSRDEKPVPKRAEDGVALSPSIPDPPTSSSDPPI